MEYRELTKKVRIGPEKEDLRKHFPNRSIEVTS